MRLFRPSRSSRLFGLFRLFALEHSSAAYRADFAVYAGAVTVLAVFLALGSPPAHWLQTSAIALVGLLSWSAMEYALHRFVLHGFQPFKSWHEEHHLRPRALICTPTVLSASLIAVLVFFPTFLLAGVWRACAFTLGVLTGYLAYAITHHATHHWRANSAWLAQRKHWHALHHQSSGPTACYGVTSGFWDHICRTSRRTLASKALTDHG